MSLFSAHSAPWTPLQVHQPDLGDFSTWQQVVVVMEHGWEDPWNWATSASEHESIGMHGTDETSSSWSCGYLDFAAIE